MGDDGESAPALDLVLHGAGDFSPKLASAQAQVLGDCMLVLAGTGASENNWDGLEQNFQVQGEAPVVDVFQVEADPFLKTSDLVAASDLPEAGQPGFHAETTSLCGGVDLSDFV